MKNNFTKQEAEKFKGITHVWVIDTMPDGILRPSLAEINVHSFQIEGIEKVEIFVSDEWGIFSPNEIFLTEEECLAAAWALNHKNYIKAMNIYDKNREGILSKMIENKVPKTLTEFCGAPSDSFEKYLKEQEELTRKEDERVEKAILNAVSEENKKLNQNRRKFT